VPRIGLDPEVVVAGSPGDPEVGHLAVTASVKRMFWDLRPGGSPPVVGKPNPARCRKLTLWRIRIEEASVCMRP
jgi:hypothetical protein